MKYKIKKQQTDFSSAAFRGGQGCLALEDVMGGRAEPRVCLSGAGGPQGPNEIKQGMGQGTQPVLGGDTAVQVPAEIFISFLLSFISL